VFELLGDDGEAKIGGHGEVADGADEQGNGEEVVEDEFAMAGLEVQADVGKEADQHDGHDCPEPVRTPLGKVG